MAVGAFLFGLGAYVCFSWWRFWKRNYGGELLTNGPYVRVRHPFYAGFLALVVGLAVLIPMLETVMLAVFSVAVIIVYVGREEEWLVSHYGRAYREYMKKVPWRLVPRVY
jgi:protein-S-isoprenylcysteine O-methyltransferase Ste14